MSRHPWVLLAILAMLAVTGQALAQGVRISAPAAGATVRGVVKVEGAKPDTDSGWISYKLQGPGGRDEYVAAVIKPYVWSWNTAAREKEKSLYPDGMYTIKAVAHSPAGGTVGESSAQVTVANGLSASEAPSSVTLRVNYARGHEYPYNVEGRRDITLKKDDPLLQPLVDAFNGILKGIYVDVSLNTSSGGPALVRKRFAEGWTRFGQEKPKNLRDVGKSFIQVINANARVETKRKDDALFELGSLTLELPKDPVRVGATWSSDLWLLLDPSDTKRHVLRAQHRLDGFQWYGGLKVARIVSSFEQKDLSLTVIYKGNPAKVTTSFKGTRYSYFAYEAGRFLALEDEIEHDFEVDSAQFSAGMGGASGASGMGGGMPGMGGGMPGAPGGMPGAPGGMPGAPGGMPGAPGGMPGGPGGMPGMGGGMPGAPGGMPGAPGGMPGMGGAPGGMPGAPGGMPGMGGAPGGMPGGGGASATALKFEATGKVVLRITESR